jgi:hypothetical protein
MVHRFCQAHKSTRYSSSHPLSFPGWVPFFSFFSLVLGSTLAFISPACLVTLSLFLDEPQYDTVFCHLSRRRAGDFRLEDGGWYVHFLKLSIRAFYICRQLLFIWIIISKLVQLWIF